MKIRHAISYDAPPDQVFGMLADPAFRQRSCEAQGALSSDIDIEPAGDGMTVRIEQVQPTAGVPSFAQKFTGATTRAIQVEEWTGPTSATLTVTTPGKPAEIRGTLTLAPDGEGTVETFECEVKVKVPLIGGKLEGLFAGLFTTSMDHEHDAGLAWLAGER